MNAFPSLSSNSTSNRFLVRILPRTISRVSQFCGHPTIRDGIDDIAESGRSVCAKLISGQARGAKTRNVCVANKVKQNWITVRKCGLVSYGCGPPGLSRAKTNARESVLKHRGADNLSKYFSWYKWKAREPDTD